MNQRHLRGTALDLRCAPSQPPRQVRSRLAKSSEQAVLFYPGVPGWLLNAAAMRAPLNLDFKRISLSARPGAAAGTAAIAGPARPGAGVGVGIGKHWHGGIQECIEMTFLAAAPQRQETLQSHHVGFGTWSSLVEKAIIGLWCSAKRKYCARPTPQR